MQARLSWFPLTSLRTVYPWRAGRELFYQTAAKAAALNRVLSTLAIGALLGGVVCIAMPPLEVAGPVLGLLLLLACFARLHRSWFHVIVAIGLVTTCHSFSWLILGLAVVNVAAAALVSVEGRLRQRLLFKPLRLGNTNVGSARLLRGRVEIAHLFLGARRSWRADRVRAAMKKVRCACRWLAKEGERFGVPVEFTHRQALVVNGSWEAEVPSSKNGYAGLLNFEQFLQRQLAAANWPRAEAGAGGSPLSRCLMVHVAGWTDQRAYAMPAFDGGADRRPFVEYAIVGACDSAATLAHELLHLFGADDFYLGGIYDQGWLAGQIGELLDAARYPFLERCVMFRSGAPLRELAVDDQTAQKVGWL